MTTTREPLNPRLFVGDISDVLRVDNKGKLTRQPWTFMGVTWLSTVVVSGAALVGSAAGDGQAPTATVFGGRFICGGSSGERR